MSARWKKLVSVGPGISEVIVTSVSLSSFCSASREATGRRTSRRCRRPGRRPGIVEAIDEVNSTRPSLRATMSARTSLARWTVERDVEVDDLQLVGEVGVDERAALPDAGVEGGRGQRPATRRDRRPELLDALVRRTGRPARLRTFAPAPAAAAAASRPASSALTIRSKPFCANCLASSRPDAAGGAGDEGQGLAVTSCVLSHGQGPTRTSRPGNGFRVGS